MSVKAGLPPVAARNARLLILGSLPGDASISARRYYAHPSNQFWRLLGPVTGDDLQALDYEQRLARLQERRIGLWDVVGSARRDGSLDQAIREARHNAIAAFVSEHADLRCVAFNGTMASTIGRRLLAGAPGSLQFLDLPSSSAANTRPFALKAARWSQLTEFL